MSDYQKFIAVGRIASEITTREVGSSTLCKFSIAINESWIDKQGQKQERTEFLQVTQWGKSGEATAKYCTKGKQVMVEGKIKTDKYDKDGETKYSTGLVADRVLFLGSKSDNGSNDVDW